MANNIFSKRTLASTSDKYSVRDIQEIVTNSDEFNKTVRSLVSTANKRINRLSEERLNSPALNKLEEMGYSRNRGFSLRGLNSDEKMAMTADVLAFLEQETSTVKGAKEYIKDFCERHDLDFDTANKVIEQTQEIADVAYTLTNNQYYAIIKGYWSVDEVLAQKGFNGDIEKYRIELAKGVSDAHSMYLSVMEYLDSNIPDTINIG